MAELWAGFRPVPSAPHGQVAGVWLRALAMVAAVAGLALTSACAPQIGDSCASSAECGQGQVCDTTSPGGYCLQYDCRPGECPDEAACIAFEQVSACLLRCDNNGDCRDNDGYVCREDLGAIGFCYLPVSDVIRVPEDEAPNASDGGTATDGQGGGLDADSGATDGSAPVEGSAGEGSATSGSGAEAGT